MKLIKNFKEEKSSFKTLREQHEHIKKESKVILDPNIVNSYLNMNQINFDYKLYTAHNLLTLSIDQNKMIDEIRPITPGFMNLLYEVINCIKYYCEINSTNNEQELEKIKSIT